MNLVNFLTIFKLQDYIIVNIYIHQVFFLFFVFLKIIDVKIRFYFNIAMQLFNKKCIVALELYFLSDMIMI